MNPCASMMAYETDLSGATRDIVDRAYLLGILVEYRLAEDRTLDAPAGNDTSASATVIPIG